MRVLLIFLGLLLYTAPSLANSSGDYEVLETVVHDPAMFTQGIEIASGDVAFESSGLYGKSKVRKYRLENNDVISEVKLAKEYFAEGLTVLEKTVYVLTWKAKTLFLLDADTLATRATLKYQGEGWGLANDGKQLIMSDGSDKLFFRNASTFAIEKEINVTWKNSAVHRINELEYADGFIWANVWFSPVVLKINPANGEVASVYDLSNLARHHTNGNDDRVLNGIAFDQSKNAFWVTGKFWSKRYLVNFK